MSFGAVRTHSSSISMRNAIFTDITSGSAELNGVAKTPDFRPHGNHGNGMDLDTKLINDLVLDSSELIVVAKTPAIHADGKHTTIESDAKLVFNYGRMNMSLHNQKFDAVFCLCSFDLRVAQRAAQLYLDGRGDYLIFSGSVGKLTEGLFDKSEAEVFADMARGMGVPADKIIIEPRATNTGENVCFTCALLEQKQLRLKSFVLVQKPYMERRTYATFKKQWPDADAQIAVTSPQLEWEDYSNLDESLKGLMTNAMVGVLIRMKEYPAKGFQIPMPIPGPV